MSVIAQRERRATAVIAVVVATVALLGSPANAATVSDPVVDGLISPLGLAVGADGTFYIAEVFAGQLTAVGKDGSRTTLYEGQVTGVDAVGKGNVAFTESVAPEADAPPSDTTLSRVTPNGKSKTLASLLAYEEEVNPDGDVTYGFIDPTEACLQQLPPFAGEQPYLGIVESNPYAVAIDGGSHLVADAAGNSIVKVSANGQKLTTVAVLPPVPVTFGAEAAAEVGAPDCAGLEYLGEPVPTDIEVGPDGHYYVSTLPGFPEQPGTGSVWRIDRATHALTEVATGLTGAVDLAVAPDGTVYVAELFADQVSKIVEGAPVTVAEVNMPGAIEATRDGRIFVTTNALGGPGAVAEILP